MNLDYKKENINVKLKTTPVMFTNHRPTDMSSYQKIDQQFQDRAVFDMWEGAVAQGEGWIGIVDEENGDLTVSGEFLTYTHTGSYASFGQACQQIMQDYPDAENFYCIYLNSPENTKEEDLQSKIIFTPKD